MALGIGSLSPEDFAAILRAAPAGGAAAPQRIPFGLNPTLLSQGADGTSRPDAATPSFGLGSQMPEPPQMAPAAAPRQAPPPMPLTPRTMTAAPMPPERPADLGAPAADMPVPNAVPTSGNLPDPAASTGMPKPEEPSFLDKVMGGIQKTDGLLGSIGMGLLTTPGLGQGLGAGLKIQQQAGVQKAATNLAQAEFLLKQRKLQQETGVLSGNASYVKDTFKRQGREITDDQAMAFGSNPSVMTELFKGVLPPTETYRQEKDAEGNTLNVNERTGQKSVLVQAKEDKNVRLLTTPEERAAAGIQPNDTRTARIDANQKVTFDSAPPAPTVQVLEDENGNKHIRQYDPPSGRWIDPAQPPGAPPAATNPFALKGKTTVDQANAGGFADRMVASERVLADTEKEGNAFWQRRLDGVPLVNNYLTSDKFQSYNQAKRAFINAQLRKESGAAIGKEEYASADQQYFPQPGESAEIAKQKAEGRRVAIEAMMRTAGTAYLPSHVYDDTNTLVPYAPGQRKPLAGGGSEPAPAGGTTAAPSTRIQQFRTQDEYAAAPSGTRFIAPDGKLRVKP